MPVTRYLSLIQVIVAGCLVGCSRPQAPAWLAAEFYASGTMLQKSWRARIYSSGWATIEVAEDSRVEGRIVWRPWRKLHLDGEKVDSLTRAVARARFGELRSEYSANYRIPRRDGCGGYARGTTDLPTARIAVGVSAHIHAVEVYGPRHVRRSAPSKPPHPDRADVERFLAVWDEVLVSIPLP